MKLKTLMAKTEPGMHPTGERSLYLRIAPGGSRQWVQRLTINGRRTMLGLGPVDLVPLDDAKAAALENRLAVYRGKDPLAERRKAATPTFAEAAERYAATKAATWRAATRKQWTLTIAKATAAFGSRRVDRIDQQDVLALLVPLWTDKPAAARMLRRHTRAVFAWAVAHNYRADNPAGEAIAGALPSTATLTKHHAAIGWRDVPGRTVHD